MPGYEPFLLCDFHVHTQWSDGQLPLREVVDLYGKTGRFDVIGITDHILMERDRLPPVGRMASMGRGPFSVTADRSAAYLREIATEAQRAKRLYDLLVIPGAEIVQHHAHRAKNSCIVGLNIREFISADQPADDILKAIRRQGALSIACHPHHRPNRRYEISTWYPWNHRQRRGDLVDVWEAANRDALLSMMSLKHDPSVGHGDFRKLAHLYSWKTLVRCEKNWDAIAQTLKANVDVAMLLDRIGSDAA